MTGYRELLWKDLRESWHSGRFPAVILLFLALGVTAPILTRLLPDLIAALGSAGLEVDIPAPGIADVLDQLIRTVVQFGAIVAILVAMGSVATERERGTAAFVLSKPLGRAAFLWAKLVAIAVLLAVAIGVAVGAAWVDTWLLFRRPPIGSWAEMAAILWLVTMVPASMTVLGSVVAPSALGAAGIGLLGLLVISLASTVPNLETWLPAGLSAVAKSVALREPSPDLEPARTILVSVGIAAVAFVLAWWRFRRADL